MPDVISEPACAQLCVSHSTSWDVAVMVRTGVPAEVEARYVVVVPGKHEDWYRFTIRPANRDLRVVLGQAFVSHDGRCAVVLVAAGRLFKESMSPVVVEELAHPWTTDTARLRGVRRLVMRDDAYAALVLANDAPDANPKSTCRLGPLRWVGRSRSRRY